MEKDFKKEIIQTLTPLATSEATARGLHLLRIDVRGAQHTPVIEVVIDGDRLISIDDCEAVSRSLNDAIEEKALVKGNFRMDVLSPGLDEPLIHDYQLHRNLGRLVEAHYVDGGETHTVHGYLREFGSQRIGIEPLENVRRKGRPTREQGEILVPTEPDEQVYDVVVELVEMERSKVQKLVVVPVFS